MKEEGLTSTEHNKIFIGKPCSITNEELENKMEELKELVIYEDTTIEEIKQTMKRVVPTYKEANEVNKVTTIEEKTKIKTIKNIISNVKKSSELKVEVG